MYMYENVQRTGNSVSDNMRKAADICDKLIHEQGTYGTYSLLTQGSGDGIPAMNTSLLRPPNTTAR